MYIVNPLNLNNFVIKFVKYIFCKFSVLGKNLTLIK